jgi:hypothetical protein
MAEALLKARLEPEIKRAERFQFQIALLLLQFQELAPPRLISTWKRSRPETNLKKATRPYDLVVPFPENRFAIAVFFQNEKSIETVITQRIAKLAEEHHWGKFCSALSIFPDEAKDVETMLNLCKKRIESVKAE